MKQTRLVLIVLLAALTLAACGPAATPTAAPATEPPPATEAPTEAPMEPVAFKIAVMPILDNLPMYVAEAEGLFAKYGITVEFVPVASAPERDQLVAAGQADGMINETLSTMFFNRETLQMQVVRFGLVPAEGSGHFFILASAQSGITTPDGLKGVEIGVSQGTIIEYMTERVLTAEGLAADEIKTLAVPKIPDRMALLASGEISAAVMPDPLAALAVQQGAVIVTDDSQYPQYGQSVYSFRKDFIDAHPEAMKGFLTAVEEAIALINADPAKYNNLLADKQLVPQPLIGSYQLPLYPAAGIPTEADWADMLEWAKAKGLLDVDVSYADSVTDAYLP
ncbi:MAG: ABC transporter substrate-binding protein [Chloroflexota bacterium]